MNALEAIAARPRQLRWGLLGLGSMAVLLFPVGSDDLFIQNMVILTFLLAIMASSWNIVSGYAGYVSLGHSAFLGIGAYATALLAIEFPGVSPFVFVPVAGVITAAIAAVVGLVLMRTRGHAFVILTIAFLLLMQILVRNWSDLTGGSAGVALPLPTWSLEYQYWPFYYALFGLLALTIGLSWWIRRTKFGMGLIAIREDEDKAAAVGVNTPVYKILGFVASTVFIGMAGGIFAYYLAFVDPTGMFDIVISVQIVLAVALGGRGTLWGPVLGAFMVEPLFEITNNELPGGNWRLVLSGGLMALVILFLPRGVLPSLGDWWRRHRSAGEAAPTGGRLERVSIAAGASAPAPPHAAPGSPILEVRGLERRFGGLRAVDGCSFSVPEGSISALIGPNGSGKTTVFNLIDGTMPPQAGEVWLGGERIDALAPWTRAHRGLGRTFQITRLFKEMTVLENVVAPLSRFSWRQFSADAVGGAEAKRAEALLEFVGMQLYRDKPAKELSFGQQKLVELAQTLMLDPKVILLDEPAGGLNPSLIKEIIGLIRELNRQGKTFLIVEHNMPVVMDLCDPINVLAQGICIRTGSAAAVQRDEVVLDAYLGEDYTAQPTAGVT